jgi:hypothetical protein
VITLGHGDRRGAPAWHLLLVLALAAGLFLVPAKSGSAALAATGHRPRLLVVGDSILAGVLANNALGQLQQELPGWEIVFDAQADRSTQGGDDVVRADDPASFDMVVVGLGANNGWSADVFAQQMRQLMDDLKPVPRVYWLTVRAVPRFATQYAAVNFVIRTVANEYPNLQAVDWDAFGVQHPEAFYGDGLHLSPAGSTEMVDFLASLVKGTNAYLIARSPSAVTTTTEGRPQAVAAGSPALPEGTARGERVQWWLVGAGIVLLVLAILVGLRARKLVALNTARALGRARHPSDRADRYP